MRPLGVQALEVRGSECLLLGGMWDQSCVPLLSPSPLLVTAGKLTSAGGMTPTLPSTCTSCRLRGPPFDHDCQRLA